MPAAGFALHAIAVEGLSRTNPLRALRALVRARSRCRARAGCCATAPDAVMGGGGYVAGPVALAALTLRIPLVLTEADSHLGLTNRMLAPFARRVCLAFPLGRARRRRYRARGRKADPAAEPGSARPRRRARARLGSAPGETCVLVFGGSLGARSINRAAGVRGVHRAGAFACCTSPAAATTRAGRARAAAGL